MMGVGGLTTKRKKKIGEGQGAQQTFPLVFTSYLYFIRGKKTQKCQT